MRILGVGIATLDVVNQVDGYPSEDDEVRALSQRMSRGGNATNSLVALSQLGHECHWAGSLADDANAVFIEKDLQRFQINLDAVSRKTDAVSPVSHVLQNSRNGSRTIVHYRRLDEFDFDDFCRIDVDQFDWIHFEGRNVEALQSMMHWLLDKGYKTFSLEIEKARDGIEALFPLPALLMFSHDYVRKTHSAGVRDFLESLGEQGIRVPVFCAWGNRGGWARGVDGQLYQQPAFAPEKVVDTLGAGDVFNAAVLHAWNQREHVDKCLRFACELAGCKCGLDGLDNLLPCIGEDS